MTHAEEGEPLSGKLRQKSLTEKESKGRDLEARIEHAYRSTSCKHGGCIGTNVCQKESDDCGLSR